MSDEGLGRDRWSAVASEGSTRLTPLAKRTIASFFARRHDHPMQRHFARSAIRDAQLWLRLTGRKSAFSGGRVQAAAPEKPGGLA